MLPSLVSPWCKFALRSRMTRAPDLCFVHLTCWAGWGQRLWSAPPQKHDQHIILPYSIPCGQIFQEGTTSGLVYGCSVKQWMLHNIKRKVLNLPLTMRKHTLKDAYFTWSFWQKNLDHNIPIKTPQVKKAMTHRLTVPTGILPEMPHAYAHAHR